MKQLRTREGLVELHANPASEEEVFISRGTLHESLADKGYSTIATSGLWNALSRNKGVALDASGHVLQTNERNLYVFV